MLGDPLHQWAQGPPVAADQVEQLGGVDHRVEAELVPGHQGPVPPGGVARVLGGRRVRSTRPLGAHPGMADVIAAQASDTLPAGTDPADVTLLLLAARSGSAALGLLSTSP